MTRHPFNSECLACTDPGQLPGWLAGEHARADDLFARSGEVRQRAEKADQVALQAVLDNADWKVIRDTQHDQQRLHGEANAHAQSALIIRGHAQRVADAHPLDGLQLLLSAAPAVQDITSLADDPGAGKTSTDAASEGVDLKSAWVGSADTASPVEVASDGA